MWKTYAHLHCVLSVSDMASLTAVEDYVAVRSTKGGKKTVSPLSLTSHAYFERTMWPEISFQSPHMGRPMNCLPRNTSHYILVWHVCLYLIPELQTSLVVSSCDVVSRAGASTPVAD